MVAYKGWKDWVMRWDLDISGGEGLLGESLDGSGSSYGREG